jgi:hypothetical protein
VWAVLACHNAGNPLAAFAMYTDDYFRRLFGRIGPYDEGAIEALQRAPTPRAEQERVALIELRDARVLEDGRIEAVVVWDDPTLPGPEEPMRMLFAKVGQSWLIDEVQPAE